MDSSAKKMIKFYQLVSLVVLLLAMGCNPTIEMNEKVITVSILPQKYFVDRITGNTFEVNVMVPPGASPATYEPTAKQMILLGGSLIYLKVGHIEFEKIWLSKIASTNKNIKIIDTSKDIDLIENSSTHNHKGHTHAGIDPHIWVSPKMAKIMVRNIYNALSQLYPDETVDFKENYNKLIEEINDLDIKTAESLSNLHKKEFLIFHPALSYFARDYGLEQIPIQLEGKDPGPAYFREIVNYAKKKDIRIVFIQEQFDIENAKVIAEEIDGEVIQINPLDYNWPKQIEHIAQSLVSFNKNQ